METIKSIEISNYKAFKRFSVVLDIYNILSGSNNSGKSTIIGALKLLNLGLLKARSRKSEVINVRGKFVTGYNLPKEDVSVSLENAKSDYSDENVSIIFNLSNGNSLELYLSDGENFVLLPNARGMRELTPKAFNTLFPLYITSIPTLGPVEHVEKIVELSTVKSNLNTHRASRNFRNYWHYYPEHFDDFAKLVNDSWMGMSVKKPEIFGSHLDSLLMMCSENRYDREIYWTGFGFQVWTQLLTHISRAKNSNSNLIIVDEPEIYLHPELQRKISSLLRETGQQIILATHSSEILSESEPSEIILVDKRKRLGSRLSDERGIQKVLDLIGSSQNITLSRLSRNQKIIFAEGDKDYRILKRFARKLGVNSIADSNDMTLIETNGFSSWKEISNIASGIKKIIGTSMHISIMLDRDYFPSEEINEIKKELEKSISCIQIHERKEIENYLLDINALERAFIKEMRVRNGKVVKNADFLRDTLRDLTEAIKSEEQANYVSKTLDYFKANSSSSKKLIKECTEKFESKWMILEERLKIVGGKAILSSLRDILQKEHNANLSDAKIIDAFYASEVPRDIKSFIEKLDKIKKT
jgi:predicted ATP-dependent endonuclease of OLD family